MLRSLFDVLAKDVRNNALLSEEPERMSNKEKNKQQTRCFVPCVVKRGSRSAVTAVCFCGDSCLYRSFDLNAVR